jgi:hypothetical protein
MTSSRSLNLPVASSFDGMRAFPGACFPGFSSGPLEG